MVDRCLWLFELGTVNAAALTAKYNVSAAELAALGTAITAFTAAQPKPQNGLALRTSATKTIETLFAELDDALNNELDPLMEKFSVCQWSGCSTPVSFEAGRAFI